MSSEGGIFVIRFYKTSPELRAAFLEKITGKYGGTIVSDGPGSLSMNPFGPPPHEVQIRFSDKATVQRVSKDAVLFSEYQSLQEQAVPGARASRRVPGDSVFVRG